MSRKQRDGCEFCLGAKGGVPGNENVFAGHLACDFCTILIMDVRREAVMKVTQARARKHEAEAGA
jgi:hypothetical protein